MSSVPQTTKQGPRTYPPVEPVAGGQVVEGRAAGVGVAAAASNRPMGIAINDAVPADQVNTEATVVNGRPVLNMVVPQTVVAVASAGIEVPGVTYAAAAEFGDLLVAAAAGAVTPAGAAPDARQIVGRCAQLGGVAAGAKGSVRAI